MKKKTQIKSKIKTQTSLNLQLVTRGVVLLLLLCHSACVCVFHNTRSSNPILVHESTFVLLGNATYFPNIFLRVFWSARAAVLEMAIGALERQRVTYCFMVKPVKRR